MKRFALILFICLAVQAGAVTAPFSHLHPQDSREGGHGEPLVVHRHLSPHTEHGDHHQVNHDAHHVDRDGAAAFRASAAVGVIALGAMDARPAAPTIRPVPAVTAVTVAPSLDSAAALDPDPDHRLPSEPDVSGTSLRGPPS